MGMLIWTIDFPSSIFFVVPAALRYSSKITSDLVLFLGFGFIDW